MAVPIGRSAGHKHKAFCSHPNLDFPFVDEDSTFEIFFFGL